MEHRSVGFNMGLVNPGLMGREGLKLGSPKGEAFR